MRRSLHRNAAIAAMLGVMAFLILPAGCSVKRLDRKQLPPDEVRNGALRDFAGKKGGQEQDRYLKAHMLNGAVYLLSEWEVDSLSNTVTGRGRLYDIYRQESDCNTCIIDIDSVAIFETNDLHISGTIVGMSIITGISLTATVICLTNPKACFGSCPTIYAREGNREVLRAEGFSASIAPALEAVDIDYLNLTAAEEHSVRLCVKNEALETHVIRSMDLLAIPRRYESPVFLGIDGNFYQTSSLIQPAACEASGDNCLEAIRYNDGVERWSAADSSDLAAGETIEVIFQPGRCENVGLVIGCRQSLLSTYLLYSGLSYLGTHAGDWMAELQRGNASARYAAGSVGRMLGGIDILVEQPGGGMTRIGTVNETGPLATDVHMVPMPSGVSSREMKIQLRLTRGHWRIDYLALACIEAAAAPIRIAPSQVLCDSVPDADARQRLLDSTLVLTTIPGDEYTLVYDFPEHQGEYELFVRSRGYYMEWMRDEWLADEDLGKAAMIFMHPEEILKMLAPEFKQIEPEMEHIFWNSKYAR
jgi:hypothetical protein